MIGVDVMNFKDFVKSLKCGYPRYTQETLVTNLFLSANEGWDDVHSKYKNWMKSEDSCTAIQKYVRDDDGNVSPFNDDSVISFLSKIKDWVSVQDAFKLCNNGSGLIDTVIDDKDDFFQSVLHQFKEILDLPFEQKIKAVSIVKNTLPVREQRFIGRSKTLREIRENFAVESPDCLMQTIFGLGGFGKTEIAIEYARKFMNCYNNGIGYVNTETRQSIKNGFIDFAEVICGEVNGALPDEELKRIVKDWLNNHNSWLLILDNIDNVDAVAYKEILSYVAGLKTGHILFTTRRMDLQIGAPVYIDTFSKEEAVDFLADRFCGKRDINGVNESNKDCLTQLAWRLGYYPLALELVAAYMNTLDPNSCMNYFLLLDDNKLEQYNPNLKAPVSRDFEKAITVTFNLCYNRLSEAAKHFLNICSFMAPEKIPLAFFRRNWMRFSVELRKAMKSDMTGGALANELKGLRLIKCEGKFLSIHRKIQEATRKRLSNNNEARLWLEYSIQAIDEEVPDLDEFTGKNTNRIEQFSEVVTHAATVLTHVRVAVEKHFAQEEFMEVVNLFQYELMIYMKILGLKNSLHIKDAIENYVKIAGLNFRNPFVIAKNILLMKAERLSAISSYKNGDLAETLSWFMMDLMNTTISGDISKLYPNLEDSLEKLITIHKIFNSMISSSPYPAAVNRMIGYIENEIGVMNGSR